jgi:two-component system sensor histidine kinase TctE
VDVSVEAMGNKACLQIADNGPGIPDGDKPRVFDRFHRLAGADIPGSGLGLAIVREIVVQQGGEIHLQDTPGGGLTVVVSLPLADAPLSTPNL